MYFAKNFCDCLRIRILFISRFLSDNAEKILTRTAIITAWIGGEQVLREESHCGVHWDFQEHIIEGGTIGIRCSFHCMHWYKFCFFYARKSLVTQQNREKHLQNATPEKQNWVKDSFREGRDSLLQRCLVAPLLMEADCRKLKKIKYGKLFLSLLMKRMKELMHWLILATVRSTECGWEWVGSLV